jgi:glycosyltransferase involved in cell wall biosynthesis
MGRMRLAWFSPMPPVRSGIAVCSEELVAALGNAHHIDVFVDEPVARAAAPVTVGARTAGALPLRSAHEFVWRRAREPYDLAIYQLGNSSHHDYVWPYLFRYPGLSVLHDARLHHARAAALLRQGRKDDYRQEFAASVPYVTRDAAELAIAGFDSALHYEWSFTDLVVAASRVTAVHSRIVARTLMEAHPGASVEHVRLGHGVPLTTPEAAELRRTARTRLGIPAEAVLFGCFGGLTPEKRIAQILAGFDAVLPYVPSARLLLAGPEAAHYDVRADISSRSLGERVTITGYVEGDEHLTGCIAACDVTLNLRWPTALEISGPWLRCLAAGSASIVIDLAHTADVPSLDPRTWTSGDASGAPPVTVAVDIMDEEHSLRLAMRRLGTDPQLRASLGEAARRYWTAHHSPAGMVEDYQRAIVRAAQTAPGRAALPAHLVDDGGRLMTGILNRFGVSVPWSKI